MQWGLIFSAKIEVKSGLGSSVDWLSVTVDCKADNFDLSGQTWHGRTVNGHWKKMVVSIQ